MKCNKCGIDKINMIKGIDKLIVDIATMRVKILELEKIVEKERLKHESNKKHYTKKESK